MAGFVDRVWQLVARLERLYALLLFSYLAYGAAYSAYSSQYATTASDGVTEYAMAGRTADIPIRIDESRAAEYAELSLFVTRDGGRTWRAAATAKPKDETFHFVADEAGSYGFAVQARLTDGRLTPASTDDLRVVYRIRFGADATAQNPVEARRADGLDALRARVDELERRVEQVERRKAGRQDEAKALRERIDRLERRLADLENDGGGGPD